MHSMAAHRQVKLLTFALSPPATTEEAEAAINTTERRNQMSFMILRVWKYEVNNGEEKTRFPAQQSSRRVPRELAEMELRN
jgi:hypothetical protein